MALSNDINAAAGGTTAIAAPARTQPSPVVPTAEDRLAQLARLKEKGLITDDEYTTKRQKLLDEV